VKLIAVSAVLRSAVKPLTEQKMAKTLSLAFMFLALVSFHTPVLAQYPAEGLEQLKKDIRAIMDEEGIPGASIALITGDEVIWAGGLGKADVAGDVDVSGDSLFRIGSISKTFTSLALLTLVEEGRLDLNTPIRDLVPELEYTNPWADTHPITVAQVLEHTTGFDDIHFVEIGKNDDPDMKVKDGLAFHPHSRISRWPPGTHHSYCNSGPPIGALILEAITGQEFEAYAREHVFAPLGMSNSDFHFPRDADLLANGYEADGETEARYDHIIFRPSGSMNASSTEMANYLQMMINRGRFNGLQLFRPETIERMERPATTLAAKAGHDFGYGLGNYSSMVAGHHFHGHDGSTLSFIAKSAYSPELGVGYFVSTNKMNGKLGDIAELIVKFLTADRVLIAGPSADLTAAELDHVAGYYQVATPRNQIMNFMYRFVFLQRIWVEEGRLYHKSLLGGEKSELISVSADSFRTEEQPVATVFLVDDEDGNRFMQVDGGVNMRKISGLWAWFQPVALILALALLLSSLLFGPVWLVARMIGKMTSVPAGLVVPQFLAPLLLFGTLVLTMMTLKTMDDLLYVSVASMTVFIGFLAFPLLSLYMAIRLFRPMPPEAGPVLRIWSRLVTLACVGLTLFMFVEDLIGLRLWSY
jgi:CubicO group peptidase (beta-lactamase class C family)